MILQGLFATLGAHQLVSSFVAWLYCSAAIKPTHKNGLLQHFFISSCRAVYIFWVMLGGDAPHHEYTVLAVARSTAGLLSLCICGAIGGFVFFKIRGKVSI